MIGAARPEDHGEPATEQDVSLAPASLRPSSLRPASTVRLVQSVPSAFEALAANKGRATLTTLGIVIGVAAVITIVALGQGSAASVTAQIANLGTNVITVMPGSFRSGGIQSGAGTMTSLKLADADAIGQQVSGIERLSPMLSGGAQIVYGNKNWQTRVQGVRPAYQQIQNWTVTSGGFFTDEDENAARNVAVIGQTIVTNLFPDGASPLGESIRVRNVPFTVIGVLASKGSGFGGDQDDTILIPFRTAQIRLFGAASLGSIVIQASRADDMTQITTDITTLLRQRHRIQGTDSDDFSIRNNNDLLTAVQGVTQTMTVLLGGVAGVSLVVGGIGIMNIMLVSVTERTREIGIRMALGARGSDILAQFLIESVVLASVGGVLGIGIGVLAAYATSKVLGYATSVPLYAVLISFGFAALVGVFFGIYPARKASHLDPIEALRYQ